MRYLITFSCYGAHLHGDEKGSVDRKHHRFGSPSLDVDPVWTNRERQSLQDAPYLLDDDARRAIVLNALQRVCEHRKSTLLAAHVRTTHVHVVVESGEEPEKIMIAFKAYASRDLNLVESREKRWTRHGSTRWLLSDEQVQRAIGYVVDEQGSPMAVYRAESEARSLTVAALKNLSDEQVQKAIGYVVDEQGPPMAVYRAEGEARSLTVAALKNLSDEQVQRAIGYVVDEQGPPMAVDRAEDEARSLTVAALKTKCGDWRREGKTVVFTNGCYDILHPGHIRLLEAARSMGDILILALNTDASVQRMKGPQRPLISENDRAQLAARLQAVDTVILFDEDTPRELIAAILPDILVKGADWNHFVAGREEVEAAGGRVETIALEPGFSTTNLVSSILNR